MIPPLPSWFRALWLIPLGLGGGCRLPPEAQIPADGGVTVRRAEAVGGGVLFAGAGELGLSAHASGINRVARIFAGMDERPSPYHQRQMEALWRMHELSRGQRLRAWAASEIADLQAHPALFYPFSGPDYLFAQELFPHAETYILCGLEAADPLPDLKGLSTYDFDLGLASLRAALRSVMHAGYFVTTDMRRDLQSSRFRGVLPVLLAFLARTGATVASVDIVRIDGAGHAVLASASGGSAPGLMIRFQSSSGVAKRLFYFRQDLSNRSLRPGDPFLSFVAKQGHPPALVKCASYLMHGDDFSTIRNHLLQDAAGLVQDPSGVPWQMLASSGLPLRLYGNYQGTLDIFAQQQPELMRAYESGLYPVQPLDFGFGYLYNPARASIIVMRRR